MKLKDIPYVRVEIEPIRTEFDQMIEEFRNSENVQTQLEIYNRYIEISKDIETNYALAYIRFTQNVEDEFYSKEKDYYDEVIPVLTELSMKFLSELINSKFLDQIKEQLSPLLIENYVTKLKTFRPEIVSDMQEENRLITEYVKLNSTAKVKFNGETLAITELNKYKLSKDREIRRKAFDTHGEFLSKNSETIDRIFDSLVKLRTSMAHKLGYKDYVEMGYDMRLRNSFNRDDIAKFREEILEYIVPAVSKLRKRQAEELGIDQVMLYDEAITNKDGDATPKGTAEDIMAAGESMYKDMSPLTNEFFQYMIDHDSFDVLARKGKSGGGYCTGIPNYKLPFIFANFNGTSHDIDVLTHEGGHAFFDYVTRNRKLYDLQVGSHAETYEVHSMSMEFFCYKYMDMFYDDSSNYKKSHFANAMFFLPYGTIVDYFQQLCYEKPEMTPSERNALWLELESKFRPDLSFDGMEYFDKGTRWQYQAHIFEHPFYYIDYCLAQTVALSFNVMIKDDWQAAWDKYMEFIYNSDKKFTDILRAIGLKTPFDKGALKAIGELVN